MKATIPHEGQRRRSRDEESTLEGKQESLGLLVHSLSSRVKWAEELVLRVGATALPVLIVGEVGTGRQLFAQWMHKLSPHCHQHFIRIICGRTLPEAFDEALQKIQETNGGTLFLDDVVDLSPPMQTKVLALLQKREGSNESGVEQGAPHLGFRLIASTAHFEELAETKKRFSPELYCRLSGVVVRLPPLRERREDIRNLVDFFQQKYTLTFGRNGMKPLGREALQSLCEYEWPGNIRELENWVKRLVLLGSAPQGEEAFPTRMDVARGQEALSVPLEGATPSLKEVARAAAQRAEHEVILEALNRTRWNRRQTAQDLRISYKTLLYKLKQLGLAREKTNGKGASNPAPTSKRTGRNHA